MKSAQSVEPTALTQKVLAIVEDAYAPTKMEIPPDFMSYDSFLRAVKRLENSSSPGLPYSTRGTTIGDVLKFDGVWYDHIRLLELWHDVQVLIKGSFDEVLYSVVIKEEPHKQSKVDQNRWRLIIVSPLHVQIYWHMCFDFMNDKHIEQSYFIPSQQGLKLNSGGWRDYRTQWVGRGYDVGLDKSSWDWTVPAWKIEAVFELKKRMVFGARQEEWEHLAWKAYRSLYFDCVLVLSSGNMYRQVVPGVMKSGCVCTITDNSLMQVIDHVYVCLLAGLDFQPLPVACGDDTLQCASQVADISYYSALGVVVKSASAGLEFVGQEFLASGPFPLYLEKHLYKLPYSTEVLDEYLDAMMRMYCYTPLFDLWYEIAKHLGRLHCVRSRAYYLAWYDYGLD